MKAVIQRVKEAKVLINNTVHSQIEKGILIFISVEDSDNTEDIEWLSGKISRLSIFNHLAGIMNLSVKETGGEVMVISQFTLHASTKKGNRPSYIKASKPGYAIPLYEKFIDIMSTDLGKKVKSGEFGADMKIHLINDGPVTIIIDTKSKE